MPGSNFYTPVTSTLWVALTEETMSGTNQLAMLAKCTGTPPTTAGLFEHGCIMTQTNSGTGFEAVYQNTGTAASPVWLKLTTNKIYTVTAKTTTTTLTAAEVVGGLITANQGAAGAATYTLPLGTDLAAALPTSFAVGESILFSVTNVSTVAAEDVTIQGNTGTTLLGSGFVASNAATTDKSSATFRIIKSGTDTFNVYRV